MVKCDIIELVGVSECEITLLMDEFLGCHIISDDTGVFSTRGELGDYVEVVLFELTLVMGECPDHCQLIFLESEDPVPLVMNPLSFCSQCLVECKF